MTMKLQIKDVKVEVERYFLSIAMEELVLSELCSISAKPDFLNIKWVKWLHVRQRRFFQDELVLGGELISFEIKLIVCPEFHV